MATTPTAELIATLATVLTTAGRQLQQLAAEVNAQYNRDRAAMTDATIGTGIAAGRDFADVQQRVDQLERDLRSELQRVNQIAVEAGEMAAELQQRLDVRELGG
jgi:glycine cleavage system regulatory protein